MVTKTGEKLLYEEITYKIRKACFKIWKQFGGAFKERIVDRALSLALKNEGLKVENQKCIKIYYDNVKVGTYTPDKIVNENVLIEVKCKPYLTKEDERQFWLYLKGSEYKLGLLINFGTKKLEIKRRVYDKARQKIIRVNPRSNPRLSASINKGFTLLELTVVIAIIILLSGIVLSNYRVGEKEYTLLRSAQKLAQDLRRAEELALSAKAYPGAPSSFKGGFGVNFQINSISYTLFADLNDNKVFDPGEDLEILNLEKKVKISGLSASPLNIVFLPPDPQVCISGNCPAISEAQITLSLETNPAKTKIIKVNQIGLITINN